MIDTYGAWGRDVRGKLCFVAASQHQGKENLSLWVLKRYALVMGIPR